MLHFINLVSINLLMSFKKTGWNDCPPVLDVTPGAKTINNLNHGLLESNESLDSQASPESVMQAYEDLIGYPSKLPGHEYAHYKKKLKAGLTKVLQSPQHCNFIEDIISRALKGESEVRTSIVNYGLVNPGVSSWTTPLRKLVENLNYQLFMETLR